MFKVIIFLSEPTDALKVIIFVYLDYSNRYICQYCALFSQ